MSSRKVKEIEGALLSKGFCGREGSRHRVFFHCVDGRKTGIHTMLSRGASDYPDNLLGAMAKQLKLRKKELLGLIDCDLSEDGYVRLLGEREPLLVAIPPSNPS